MACEQWISVRDSINSAGTFLFIVRRWNREPWLALQMSSPQERFSNISSKADPWIYKSTWRAPGGGTRKNWIPARPFRSGTQRFSASYPTSSGVDKWSRPFASSGEPCGMVYREKGMLPGAGSRGNYIDTSRDIPSFLFPSSHPIPPPLSSPRFSWTLAYICPVFRAKSDEARGRRNWDIAIWRSNIFQKNSCQTPAYCYVRR